MFLSLNRGQNIGGALEVDERGHVVASHESLRVPLMLREAPLEVAGDPRVEHRSRCAQIRQDVDEEAVGHADPIGQGRPRVARIRKGDRLMAARAPLGTFSIGGGGVLRRCAPQDDNGGRVLPTDAMNDQLPAGRGSGVVTLAMRPLRWLILLPLVLGALACRGRFKLPADARFVTEIRLGDGFGCARMKDGSARTWGANESGALGDGTTEARAESVRVRGAGRMGASRRRGEACVRGEREGEVFCWGTNGAGELGDGSRQARSSPVRAGNAQAKELALGAHHSCALSATGDVSCWGADDAGQLGGVDAAPRSCMARPPSPRGGRDLRDPQGPRALVLGRVPARGVLPVTRIDGIADVTDVAVNDTHVCAVRAWGGVACWGSDEEGELGDGAFTDRRDPVEVVGLAVPARQVAVGRAHSCALLRNSTVHCWGANGSAQLADGTNAHRASPVLVNGLFEIEGITAAGDATCARFSDGSGRCWGG